jgi:hypothetical protein
MKRKLITYALSGLPPKESARTVTHFTLRLRNAALADGAPFSRSATANLDKETNSAFSVPRLMMGPWYVT